MGTQDTPASTWHFSLISKVQVAVCDLEGADATQFRSVMDRLIETLPTPPSAPDARLMMDTLHAFAATAGSRFHRQFHRTNAACAAASLLEDCETVWSCGLATGRKAASVLALWSREFLDRFQASHPTAPEIRAALRLRHDFRQPLDVNDVARAVAISRALLTRRFRQTFGVSLGEYQRMLRAREAIRLLRQTSICMDAVARDVGYQSTKNLYAVLRSYTGLRPDEIRQVEPPAFSGFSQRCRSMRIDPPPSLG